jgi:hypothetical protein
MEQVSFQQGYEMLRKFLEIYQDLGTDTDDIQRIIQQMQWKDGNPVNPSLWELWISCVEKVLQDSGK